MFGVHFGLAALVFALNEIEWIGLEWNGKWRTDLSAKSENSRSQPIWRNGIVIVCLAIELGCFIFIWKYGLHTLNTMEKWPKRMQANRLRHMKTLIFREWERAMAREWEREREFQWAYLKFHRIWWCFEFRRVLILYIYKCIWININFGNFIYLRPNIRMNARVLVVLIPCSSPIHNHKFTDYLCFGAFFRHWTFQTCCKFTFSVCRAVKYSFTPAF